MKYERESKEFEEKANILPRNLSEIELAIRTWKKEKKIIEPAKKVDERNGTIVLLIEDKEVEVPLTKDARKTIDEYFSKAKKSRTKIGKTKEWIEKTVGVKKVKEKSEKKAEWFDQFRNFMTSDGFLVRLEKMQQQTRRLLKNILRKMILFCMRIFPVRPLQLSGAKAARSAKKRSMKLDSLRQATQGSGSQGLESQIFTGLSQSRFQNQPFPVSILPRARS